MFRKLLLLGLIAVIFISCEPKKMKSITPIELQETMKEESVFVIDLRDRKSYAKSHINGAQHIEFTNTFQHTMEKFDKDETIILYAEKEDEAMKAASVLFKEDFKLVYFLMNSYSSWESDLNSITYEK
ncbi:rhodanese-like domain-containing protein [Mesonia sp. MT50]|uniref:Rhodanese-like domain-containing protein n=1 Tax=Mesonia profundi TaxID=3070998 RepID=A0ABU1A1B1_9FLAO|nr:rhodanese-like domain-containing protein [Mesonia profundi]MDQ7917457.1 rhodanese-like domain-containing protein [Mesonia profundi]